MSNVSCVYLTASDFFPEKISRKQYHGYGIHVLRANLIDIPGRAELPYEKKA